ncbi:MAG: MFS transporter [Actinomycetota bacterium]|nr:MFS transporter [Actinomycetota bacterium]
MSAPRLWPLFVFSAAGAGFSAVDSPTRSAVVPGLVARRQLPAAYAVNHLGFQLAHVVGPALAGLVIARLGLAATYWLDVASFGAAIAALVAARPLAPQRGGT